MSQPEIAERIQGCLYGMFIADALAMPVHWYYETDKLRKDYGRVTDFLSPRNPHPDSFMEQAAYSAPNPKGEILHDQAKHWGKKNVHYHQFLKPGENTLNLKLAHLVWKGLRERDYYDVDDQLERYIQFMTHPGNHRDTYIESCHQFFFLQFAQGRHPLHCGREEKHIGGLPGIVPILAHYHDQPEAGRIAALQHLYLTHLGPAMKEAAIFLIGTLQSLFDGHSLKEILAGQIKNNPLLNHPIEKFLSNEDAEIVGGKFKTSCYVEHSIPAVAYLALKYAEDPEQALIANTNLGGDNCYRGAVLGAILGAARGVQSWPKRWLDGLLVRVD